MSLPRAFRRSILAGVGLLVGTVAALQAQLAERSPFLPPAEVRTEAPAPTALEYLGFLQTPEGVLFRVRDAERRQAAFVRLGDLDPDTGIRARHFDRDNAVLIVERDGRTWTLPERKGRIVTAGNPPVMPPPKTAGAGFSPAITQTVHVNPTASQEIDRLNAVAAEIKKKREERERALQGGARP